MRTKMIFLVMAAMGISLIASADSIKIGDKLYENVYVSEGANIYYVSIPSDGTVVNVPKSDVDAKSIALTEDREARKALYNAWVAKRRELRGGEVVEPLNMEAADAAEPPKQDPEEKPRVKTVSASGRSGGSSDSQGAAYASEQQYSQRMRALREAQLDARRRQHQSAKVRELTQRRVITSEDASRGSGGGFGGGYGGGGYGGGMGGGFGGGYGRR